MTRVGVDLGPTEKRPTCDAVVLIHSSRRLLTGHRAPSERATNANAQSTVHMDTSACFFPQRDQEPPSPSNILKVPCRDGASLTCLRARAANPIGPTLVHFHGNGELASKQMRRSDIDGIPNFRDALDFLMKTGRLGEVIFVEYRGYGANAALGPPSMEALLSDADDIIAALGISDERLVVMGRSIGTIPAVHIARTRPNINALVLESGMADPLSLVASRCQIQTDAISGTDLGRCLGQHEDTIRSFRGHLLVLHCADDEMFPGDGSQMWSWSATTATCPDGVRAGSGNEACTIRHGCAVISGPDTYRPRYVYRSRYK